jgi:hypothetical protein
MYRYFSGGSRNSLLNIGITCKDEKLLSKLCSEMKHEFQTHNGKNWCKDFMNNIYDKTEITHAPSNAPYAKQEYGAIKSNSIFSKVFGIFYDANDFKMVVFHLLALKSIEELFYNLPETPLKYTLFVTMDDPKALCFYYKGREMEVFVFMESLVNVV